MSNIMDKRKFIEWCESRMKALQDHMERGAGGGMVDYLAKYNETKYHKEAAERGVFEPPIWE